MEEQKALRETIMQSNSISPVTQALAATFASKTETSADRAQQREIIQAVHAVNKAEVFGQNSELTYALDRETRRPVLRIVDKKTREVIDQIPSERVLALARESLK
jgi:flagellar protein FlaG